MGKYSPTKPQSALTTIEVLAGTILLAFLIVAVLELSAQYQRQRLLARTRIEVCQRVDDLLFEWFLSGEPLPANASGPLPGGSIDLTWESQTEELDVMEGIKEGVNEGVNEGFNEGFKLGHLQLNVFKTEEEPDIRDDLAPILSISLLVSIEDLKEGLLEDLIEDSPNPIDEGKP